MEGQASIPWSRQNNVYKTNPGKRGKPLFLETDKAIIARYIVLAFRYRSRRPVLAHARTEHDGGDDKIYSLIIYSRNRPARVGSSL